MVWLDLSLAADAGAAFESAEDPVLVVVGGGAAGVFGAVRAKTVCPHLEVVVLEKGKLLSKVFSTLELLSLYVDFSWEEGNYS